MIESAKLKILLPNKTVVFKSPIEGDDVLVRSGTSSESSSFFHCILHSYSKEYPSMNAKERIKLVRRLCSSLSSKVDRETWEDMDGGLISKNSFKENVTDIFLNCYRFLNDDPKAKGHSTHRVIKNLIGDNEKSLEAYKLVTELIPLVDGFEKIILPNAYDKSENKKISDVSESIIKEANFYLKQKKDIKSISQEKSEYVREIVRKFITACLKEADEEAFKKFVSFSQNITDNIDVYTISLVSKRFKRDIYFLDSRNRMPYIHSNITENLKKRKSIIVLCLEGGYYEIVGKLLPGNCIQREFDHSDTIIQKLYTFLVNPEKVSDTFKDLVEYLPEKYRKTDSPNEFRKDDSDSDSDSDSESSSTESD